MRESLHIVFFFSSNRSIYLYILYYNCYIYTISIYSISVYCSLRVFLEEHHLGAHFPPGLLADGLERHAGALHEPEAAVPRLPAHGEVRGFSGVTNTNGIGPRCTASKQVSCLQWQNSTSRVYT